MRKGNRGRWLFRRGWILAAAMAFNGVPAHAQSLRELYLAALTTDPTLASNEAQHRATAERVRQARADMLPTVGVAGSASSSTFTPDDGSDTRNFQSQRW